MKKPWHKRFHLPEPYHKFFFNWYSFSIAFFIVWLTFFDQNDFILRYSYHKKLVALKKERQYYIDQIEKNKNEMQELFSDDNNLEKFAREKYYMKRDKEDVFVFVDEKNRPASISR